MLGLSASAAIQVRVPPQYLKIFLSDIKISRKITNAMAMSSISLSVRCQVLKPLNSHFNYQTYKMLLTIMMQSLYLPERGPVTCGFSGTWVWYKMAPNGPILTRSGNWVPVCTMIIPENPHVDGPL